MHTVCFNSLRVLNAADDVFRMILEQKTNNYTESKTDFGVYFVNDASIVDHVKKELEIIDQLWQETLANYAKTYRAKVEIDTFFGT